MKLCAPDSLHVLQPGDRHEPGFAVVVVVRVVSTAVAAADVRPHSIADVVGRGRRRLVTAIDGRRRRCGRRLKRDKHKRQIISKMLSTLIMHICILLNNYCYVVK